MIKTYPIDFVRQLIEQTLLEMHLKEPSKYFGGVNQVSLFSFYEQLETNEQVDRYTEIYRDLTEQQNRTGLIMNGTILAPENPTITNINSSTIIPLSFTLAFRVKLKDRDTALDTLNHLVELLKGRSHDIAEMKDNGKLFKVGTCGNNVVGVPLIKSGDFIGYVSNIEQLSTSIPNLLSKFEYYGFQYDTDKDNHYYYIESRDLNGLQVVKKVNGNWEIIVDDNSYQDIIFPPTTTEIGVNKYKLSISFDSVRCDEPRTLNGNDYCIISLGGSATLVNDSVMLGNNMTKLGIKKYLVKADTDIDIGTHMDITWLEPLEMPSGNSADTQVNQLLSNKFIQNTHTDALTISLQYSFVLDFNVSLLKQWFEYARYGIQPNGSSLTEYYTKISPNIIYKIKEIWCHWGQPMCYEFNAKIVESIDIENTESDTLSITIPFQLQGENN